MTTSRVTAGGAHYHLGFGAADLDPGTTIALLSGDPSRSEHIAADRLSGLRVLSRHRGLDAFAAKLPGGSPVVSATSGMGAPSMSIVVNELFQVGIRTVIRIGTSGSIQEHVRIGSVVIGSGALTNQGAALDIAPVEYPAVADPFLAVTLADAARRLGIDHHVGVMASTDTFYEGQERSVVVGQPAPAATPPRHHRRVPRPRRAQLRDGGRHAVQDGSRVRLRRRRRRRHHRPAQRGRGAGRGRHRCCRRQRHRRRSLLLPTPGRPVADTESRLAHLDGLRAVLVLAVMAHHMEATFKGWVQPLFKAGWLPVDGFFVLSGFLIMTALLREHQRPWHDRRRPLPVPPAGTHLSRPARRPCRHRRRRDDCRSADRSPTCSRRWRAPRRGATTSATAASARCSPRSVRSGA